MKKLTLKGLINEYDRRMNMLCDSLVPIDDTSKYVYEDVKKSDRKELKAMFNEYKAGYYPEDWILDKMIETVLERVHWYNKGE